MKKSIIEKLISCCFLCIFLYRAYVKLGDLHLNMLKLFFRTVLVHLPEINKTALAIFVAMSDSISLQKELNDVEFESVIDGKWPVTWLVLHLV